MNVVPMSGMMAVAMKDLMSIGHRGARGYEPENTIRSVKKAMELGVNGIEIDVQNIGGELVVIHDDTVDRTTDGRGALSRFSLEQLRLLDAGKGEKIPLLHEILDTVNRNAFVNIELKARDTAKLTEQVILDYVKYRGWEYADFIVSSFYYDELQKISDPDIRIGILFHRSPRQQIELAKKLNAYSVHHNMRFTNAQYVQEAHRNGLKVFAYTVNHPRSIARMRTIGMDGVFTDYPDRIHEARHCTA